MDRIITTVARACLALAATFFVLFILMILAQVSYRYLGVSMVFSEEAARLLNVYSVFFGLVFVIYAGADVRINLIDRLLGDRPGLLRALHVFYLAMALTFLTVLTIGSFLLAESNWRWALPSISFLSKGHVYVAPFIGGLLSALIVLYRLLHAFNRDFKLENTVEEID